MASDIISQFEKDNNDGLCFYRVLSNSTHLEQFEKVQHYHIDPVKIKQFKGLLGKSPFTQVEQHEHQKIYLGKTDIQVDNRVKNLVQKYYNKLSDHVDPNELNDDEEESD